MLFRAATATVAATLFLVLPAFSGEKLSPDERIEIERGLVAEYANAKITLPRSKKALDYHSDGSFDKTKWEMTVKELGPVARVGDKVQITAVTIEHDRILLEINHGMKSGKKWYDHVQVGMGGNTAPVHTQENNAAPAGTYIALIFDKEVPAIQAADLKKMLAPILDFDKRSATESYTAQLPPEVQAAIKQNKAIEGMDRDTVLLALGRPRSKSRETKDGTDLEDWIYGQAPGKITFVTFANNKVVKVKEDYAELGGSTVSPTGIK